jgi:hypothetical protein
MRSQRSLQGECQHKLRREGADAAAFVRFHELKVSAARDCTRRLREAEIQELQAQGPRTTTLPFHRLLANHLAQALSFPQRWGCAAAAGSMNFLARILHNMGAVRWPADGGMEEPPKAG